MGNPVGHFQLNGKFRIIILLGALRVMLGGGMLMWHLIHEYKTQPRPQTQNRYLKSNEAKRNAPVDFNRLKVDENQLTP